MDHERHSRPDRQGCRRYHESDDEFDVRSLMATLQQAVDAASG